MVHSYDSYVHKGFYVTSYVVWFCIVTTAKTCLFKGVLKRSRAYNSMVKYLVGMHMALGLILSGGRERKKSYLIAAQSELPVCVGGMTGCIKEPVTMVTNLRSSWLSTLQKEKINSYRWPFAHGL